MLLNKLQLNEMSLVNVFKNVFTSVQLKSCFKQSWHPVQAAKVYRFIYCNSKSSKAYYKHVIQERKPYTETCRVCSRENRS